MVDRGEIIEVNPSASSSGGGLSSAPTNTPALPAREFETPDEMLKLTSDGIYYVILAGIQYNLLEATIQNFLDNGFTIDKDDDVNREVDSGKYGGLRSDGGMFLYQGSRWVYINPINHTDNKIPLKNCKVSMIFIEKDFFPDAYIVCNLTFGCSVEDVYSVFGENEHLLYYEGPGLIEGRGIHFWADASGVWKIAFVNLIP